MARIVITTFGSSGDLNPFIAIGLGLRARGHEVIYAVEDIFRPPLEALGFSVARLTGDSEAALAPYQRRMFGKTTPFTSLRYIFTYYIEPTMRPKNAELREACASADLLLSSAVQYAASAVADLTGVLWLTVALTPSFPSARIDPSVVEVPLLSPSRQSVFVFRACCALHVALSRHRAVHGRRQTPSCDTMNRVMCMRRCSETIHAHLGVLPPRAGPTPTDR